MPTDMFRIELLHPFVVHLPIALLFNAGLVRVLLFVFNKRQWSRYLKAIYFWSLTVGTLGLFAAYLSGEQAEHVVERLICDPSVIEDHEDFGKLTVLFSLVSIAVATVAAVMSRSPLQSPIEEVHASRSRLDVLREALVAIEVFALAAALASCAYTSHLGASLVYQQGAGYHRSPDPHCNDSVESINGRSDTVPPQE